jgi:hypothetical protein
MKVVHKGLLPYFILPGHPFHEGYQYLSAVGKADYQRCYLMHFYGGGYADIKHIHFDYEPYFKQLYEGPEDKYAVGYHVDIPLNLACGEVEGEDPCHVIKQQYQEIMGIAAYIHKKGSPITDNWYRRVLATMDKHLEGLKAHPAKVSRDFKGATIYPEGE